jgi:hypothetical protein
MERWDERKWKQVRIASCSWLKHCATSRKFEGSIPDEVIGFFNLPNPSNRIMAPGSTQPPTEMSTRNLPGGKGRPARKADSLTTIWEPIVWKMWESRRLTILWASTVCYRNSFTFILTCTHSRVSVYVSLPPELVLKLLTYLQTVVKLFCECQSTRDSL